MSSYILDVTVDADGAELLRGDLIVVDGRPAEVRGMVHCAGRDEVILGDGLCLAARNVRRAERDETPAGNGGTTTNQGEPPMEAIETTAREASPQEQLAVSLQDPATAGVLPTLKREQLEHIAKHLHVKYSGVKKDELIAAITEKLPTGKPATKDVTPRFKTAAESSAAKAKPVTKAVEPMAKPAASSKTATIGTVDERGRFTHCQNCGFQFTEPKSSGRCNSPAACDKRKSAGDPTIGRRGAGTSTPAGKSKGSTVSKAASQQRAANVKKASVEAKALRAWEVGGKKGKRPATPTLDALNAEKEAAAS